MATLKQVISQLPKPTEKQYYPGYRRRYYRLIYPTQIVMLSELGTGIEGTIHGIDADGRIEFHYSATDETLWYLINCLQNRIKTA